METRSHRLQKDVDPRRHRRSNHLTKSRVQVPNGENTRPRCLWSDNVYIRGCLATKRVAIKQMDESREKKRGPKMEEKRWST